MGSFREALVATTFHEREQAFEARFAHNEEFRFRVAARRDKLFARWAAGELGLSSEEVGALVKAVLDIPNGPKHDRALLQYISDVLSRGHAGPPQVDVSAALERCRREALQQLITAPPDYSEGI